MLSGFYYFFISTHVFYTPLTPLEGDIIVMKCNFQLLFPIRGHLIKNRTS